MAKKNMPPTASKKGPHKMGTVRTGVIGPITKSSAARPESHGTVSGGGPLLGAAGKRRKGKY